MKRSLKEVSNEESSSDAENYSELSKKTHKIKKSKKIYEPIYENQVMIKYEDDPVEYKKARK